MRMNTECWRLLHLSRNFVMKTSILHCSFTIRNIFCYVNSKKTVVNHVEEYFL